MSYSRSSCHCHVSFTLFFSFPFKFSGFIFLLSRPALLLRRNDVHWSRGRTAPQPTRRASFQSVPSIVFVFFLSRPSSWFSFLFAAVLFLFLPRVLTRIGSGRAVDVGTAAGRDGACSSGAGPAAARCRYRIKLSRRRTVRPQRRWRCVIRLATRRERHGQTTQRKGRREREREKGQNEQRGEERRREKKRRRME